MAAAGGDDNRGAGRFFLGRQICQQRRAVNVGNRIFAVAFFIALAVVVFFAFEAWRVVGPEDDFGSWLISKDSGGNKNESDTKREAGK